MSSPLAEPVRELDQRWRDFLERGLLGPARLVGNAGVEIAAVRGRTLSMPVTINRRGRAGCSWVTSLRNAYGPYARAEADLVPMSAALKPLYRAASYVAEALLSAGGLSGGCYLNNWLLSTNLHPAALSLAELSPAIEHLRASAASQPIVIRSLTPRLHAPLIAELIEANFLLLPSRQIWIVDDPRSGAWRKHRDARADLSLVRQTASEWTWVSGCDFSDADYVRALHLYQRLYRERYPTYNPDYTESFLRLGVSTGFLELTGLRQVGAAALSGIIGMTSRDGVSTCSLLGYDLDQPPATGLYRRLALRSTLTAEQDGTMLHCSAGAGAFKFSRGARPHLEFSAVWANDLPGYRRASLRTLSTLLHRLVVPYLESHHV